ncbi:tumor necrosis factor receptor superfamily member 25 isoform X2 [Choloepus didactylus]|uniref:tumor necrosis factor receptor superfamily member 25 isoform X2 n=1 Tax=Choloepus didactylus TaxID=27675 RepID=UPI0018A06FAB|nr:tumor necrosis factor receptor superfamily member 25 isoform X2 [Choloepus didactylus]
MSAWGDTSQGQVMVLQGRGAPALTANKYSGRGGLPPILPPPGGTLRLELEPKHGEWDTATFLCVPLCATAPAAPRRPGCRRQVSSGVPAAPGAQSAGWRPQGARVPLGLPGMAEPRPGRHSEAGSTHGRGAGPAGGRGREAPAAAHARRRARCGARRMERRPGGCAAAAAGAAALLLALLGAQGQGSIAGPRCDCAGDFQKRSGLLCCGGCPAGHYLKTPCTKPCGAATCLPCPRGTFLARENHHETRCARCQACDEEASQVALENCSAVADTRCGCQPGWFMECSVRLCSDGSPFHCRPCPDCAALHRHSRAPCSGRRTDCGDCLPGFYGHADSCVPCPTSTLGSCPEPCAAVCGWRQMFWVQVLLAGLVAPLLLGATLTYTYRRCQPCKPAISDEPGMEALTSLRAMDPSPPDSAHTLLAPPGSSEKVGTVQLADHSWAPSSPQTQEASCPEVTWSWDQLPSRALAPPAGSAVAVLQPGPQLYDVMDAVPARRWKEFVRTLGLREAEIEAVEVEIGRFRDQQYEMLKRWRQQQPAGLGAVYAALERMGLDGCAEDLRSRLQRGP